MDFSEWLTAWLARHPLKAPADTDRRRFANAVMARVQSEASAPTTHWAHRLAAGWPRLVLPLAAAAALLVAVHLRRPAEPKLAALVQGTELLAEVGEPVNGWLLPEDADTLAADLEHDDLLVLAEEPQDTDASWISESLQILDQLEEELPEAGASIEPTDDQWLEELESLDQQDLAARS